MSNLIDSLEYYYAKRDDEGNINQQGDEQPELDEELDEDDEYCENEPTDEELDELEGEVK